jgi:uncharacterized protein (TIGR03083 family)
VSPPLSRAAAEELLAAVALHATSDDEAAAVEALAAADPELAAALGRLRRAAARLASLEERAPAPHLREAVLATAWARRQPATPAGLYREVVADMDDLLGSLTPADWAHPTVYDWTVADMVAHLAATEVLIADLLDGRRDAARLDDLLSATAAARASGRTPAEHLERWRGATALVAGHPDVQPGAPRRQLAFAFSEMSVRSMILSRSFEIHTHACDIRRALGRPLAFPSPGHYRLMAEMSVRTWPAALALGGRSRPGAAARIVLTGDGGGEWTIPLHPGEPPTEPVVTLTLDAVEFCLLAADRLRPGDLHVAVEPPEATPIADDLLAVATAFASE